MIGSVTLAFSSVACQLDRQEKERASAESMVLANIGKVIGSTLKIEDVYERFAGEVGRLIPFDRILITVDKPEDGTIQIAYAAGSDVPGFQPGKKLPSRDSFNERIVQDRAPALFQPASLEEVERKYPSLVVPFQAGLRSMLSAPLISGNRVIGILHLRSQTPQAYTDQECGIIERIADQIAGAIANSELFKERNKVQEALKESEEKLRKMSAAAQDAIIMMDEGGHISFWNRAAENMFGYSSREALSGDLHVMIVPPHFRQDFEKRFPLFLETGQGNAVGRTLELQGVRKGGGVFPLELSLSGVRIKDRWHAIGILRDITERKRAEEQIIQAKEEAESLNRQLKEAFDQANFLSLEAAAANRAKSAFLANMSHEIRTPMNGVVGMTELLLDTDLAPEQREYAKTGQQSADSLLKVINEILDFSKIEAGKLDLETIDFNLRFLLEEILDLLAVTAHGKGLEIGCVAGPDVPGMLRGDPFRLRQILINLCGNAIKFTEKGEVVIRVSLEEENAARAKVRFAVVDTGIGIPRDRRDCLFQPFSQAAASATRKYGGTGLGLTISKRPAEMMGGQIGLESEEGKGSTFWFTAVLEKRPWNGEERIAVPGDLQGEHILVVDDNETNRFIISEHLKVWGCEYDEAANGTEALARLRKSEKEGNAFRIAILDMLMPDMDGATLAKKIKGDPHLTSMFLVLLTSKEKWGDNSIQREDAGFSACLMKPIKSSQLHNCLRMLVGKKTFGQSTLNAIIMPQTLSAEKMETTKILLAEDNLINQKVALGMLRKIGYPAEVAENGQEVLKALKKASYDLILMDVQMPEMDGFAATAAIRQEEEKTGRHIPIIAMTAHAMRGDRELCLEKGMDEYVSKPIQAKQLLEAIERQRGKMRDRKPETLPAGSFEEKEIFQEGMLLDHLSGDKDLYEEIIRTFLGDAPIQIARLRQALEEGDSNRLESQAHSLKGAAMNIGGTALQTLAYEIEKSGKNRDLEKARAFSLNLDTEFEKLKSSLNIQLGVKKPAEGS